MRPAYPQMENSVPLQILPWGPNEVGLFPSCPNLSDPALWASLPVGPAWEGSCRVPKTWASGVVTWWGAASSPVHPKVRESTERNH